MNVTYAIKNKKIKKLLSKSIKYKNYKAGKLKYMENPKNYFLIGHAYEIMFQLEHLKNIKSRNISQVKCFRGSGLLVKFQSSAADKDKNKINKLLSEIARAEKVLLNYIYGTGTSKKEYLSTILKMAYITQIRNISDINKKMRIKRRDIEDMETLRRGIKKFKQLFKENINYNFMFYGNKINGEADIIYKNTILDIKTVSSPYLTKDMINQLILYYLLSGKTYYEVKYIGILYSRYGKIKKMKVRDLISKKREDKLRKALEEDIC